MCPRLLQPLTRDRLWRAQPELWDPVYISNLSLEVHIQGGSTVLVGSGSHMASLVAAHAAHLLNPSQGLVQPRTQTGPWCQWQEGGLAVAPCGKMKGAEVASDSSRPRGLRMNWAMPAPLATPTCMVTQEDSPELMGREQLDKACSCYLFISFSLHVPQITSPEGTT